MLLLIFSKHVSQKVELQPPSALVLFLWSKKPGCRHGFNINPVLSQCVTPKKKHHYQSERVLLGAQWATWTRGAELWRASGSTTHTDIEKHSQLHAIVLNQLPAGRKRIKLGGKRGIKMQEKMWTLKKWSCRGATDLCLFIGFILLVLHIYVYFTFSGFLFLIVFLIYVS